MQVLRLHDPSRRPANWTDVIRRDQFAAFAKDLNAGAPCDFEGRPFADLDAATCVVFDSLRDARQACEAAVQHLPAVQIEVFDAEGRARPPLLTVLHPDRAATLESSPRALARRRVLGWCLVIGGLPLLVVAYLLEDIRAILPGFVGLNMILFGGRLFWFNLGIREVEREREERLAGLDGRER